MTNISFENSLTKQMNNYQILTPFLWSYYLIM